MSFVAFEYELRSELLMTMKTQPNEKRLCIIVLSNYDFMCSNHTVKWNGWRAGPCLSPIQSNIRAFFSYVDEEIALFTVTVLLSG